MWVDLIRWHLAAAEHIKWMQLNVGWHIPFGVGGGVVLFRQKQCPFYLHANSVLPLCVCARACKRRKCNFLMLLLKNNLSKSVKITFHLFTRQNRQEIAFYITDSIQYLPFKHKKRELLLLHRTIYIEVESDECKRHLSIFAAKIFNHSPFIKGQVIDEACVWESDGESIF